MTDAPVQVRDQEGVRWLTLDRPPANAIDESLMLALEEATADAEVDDTVRAVVLTGAGDFFCAGFDLGASRRDEGDADAAVTLYRSSHRRFLALPKPTVALVNGHAIAGGLVLALACDVRLAVDGPARFGLNEVAIGASFPAAAIEIVKARLSPQVAAELTLHAGLYSISDGLRTGAFERLLAPDEAADEAQRVAARLGAYPREVFAHTKLTLLREALAHIDAASMEDERATAELWRSEESRAARAAQRARLGRS
jgi:enoyl-CoA hydratase/carnithine racemase